MDNEQLADCSAGFFIVYPESTFVGGIQKPT